MQFDEVLQRKSNEKKKDSAQIIVTRTRDQSKISTDYQNFSQQLAIEMISQISVANCEEAFHNFRYIVNNQQFQNNNSERMMMQTRIFNERFWQNQRSSR